MATFQGTSQCQDGDEDVMAQKDALENLNTRKSTSRRILTGILSQNFENSELEPNLRSKHLTEWSSRSMRSRINMSKITIANVIRHPCY